MPVPAEVKFSKQSESPKLHMKLEPMGLKVSPNPSYCDTTKRVPSYYLLNHLVALVLIYCLATSLPSVQANNYTYAYSSANSSLSDGQEVDIVTGQPVGPIVEDLQAVESQHHGRQNSSSTFFASPPYSTVISLLPPVTITYLSSNKSNSNANGDSSFRGNFHQFNKPSLNNKQSQSEDFTMGFDEAGVAYINNSGKAGEIGAKTNSNKTSTSTRLSHGLSRLTGLEREQDELRERQKTLDVVRQANANLLESLMVTNRTRAYLSCETGDMLIKMNFTQPFKGLVYTNYDRLTPCRLFGDGSRYYELRVPLLGCGTKQEAPRLFLNNMIIRFHRSLELEEDEVKTVVCRYPPPLASPPSQNPQTSAPERIIEGAPEPAKLSYFDPLLIISGLLFMTLLLVGLGFGTYAIKRQDRRDINTMMAKEPRVPIAPSVVAQTVYDSFVDTKSVVDTGEIDTLNRRSETYRKVAKYEGGRVTVIATHAHTDRKAETTETTTNGPKYTIKSIEDIYRTRIEEVDELQESKIQRHHQPGYARVKEPPGVAVYTTFAKDHDSCITTQKEVLRPKDHEDSAPDSMSILEEPQFVSMRPTLTSPEQFKRLQTIVDIFDETIIERHVSRSDNSSLEEIVYESRPRPSKYRAGIHELEPGQRAMIHRLLTSDENFRSLAVECTSEEKIARKMRRNRLYRGKLKPAAWDLLTTVLIETGNEPREQPNSDSLDARDRDDEPGHLDTSHVLISDVETVISASANRRHHTNNDNDNVSASIPDYQHFGDNDSLTDADSSQIERDENQLVIPEVTHQHLMLIPRPHTTTSAFISRHQHHLVVGQRNGGYQDDVVFSTSSKITTSTGPNANNRLQDISASDSEDDDNQHSYRVHTRRLYSPRPDKRQTKVRTRNRMKTS